jgi:hypothetical protein
MEEPTVSRAALDEAGDQLVADLVAMGDHASDIEVYLAALAAGISRQEALAVLARNEPLAAYTRARIAGATDQDLQASMQGSPTWLDHYAAGRELGYDHDQTLALLNGNISPTACLVATRKHHVTLQDVLAGVQSCAWQANTYFTLLNCGTTQAMFTELADAQLHPYQLRSYTFARLDGDDHVPALTKITAPPPELPSKDNDPA